MITKWSGVIGLGMLVGFDLCAVDVECGGSVSRERVWLQHRHEAETRVDTVTWGGAWLAFQRLAVFSSDWSLGVVMNGDGSDDAEYARAYVAAELSWEVITSARWGWRAKARYGSGVMVPLTSAHDGVFGDIVLPTSMANVVSDVTYRLTPTVALHAGGGFIGTSIGYSRLTDTEGWSCGPVVRVGVSGSW